eukprot:scaffold9505_cov202-Alexandrium_tamarense.AAC.2
MKLPHDMTVVTSVTRKVWERLQVLKPSHARSSSTRMVKSFLPTLAPFKTKGSGVATRIRMDMNACSFVLLHSLKQGQETRPFLDFNLSEMKLTLEGCWGSCLTGDLCALAKVNFFNPISGWEHIIEPFQIVSAIEQMPDELVVANSVTDMITVNLTGVFLEEMSNLHRFKKQSSRDAAEDSSQPTIVARGVSFVNNTGIDVSLCIDCVSDQSECEDIFVHHGHVIELSLLYPGLDFKAHSLTLRANQRAALRRLPLNSSSLSGRSTFLYKWPHIHTQCASTDHVVECVMQNQRLRPNVADVYGLDRGQDLLSSTAWSPASSKSAVDDFWQPPYLEYDVPEWSDMTGTIETKRDTFIVPDGSWTWANEWEVEVNDGLGENNDCDGWEYSSDFETFTEKRRFYERGDTCRRRRWTRTRLIKKVSDVNRTLPVVWEVRKEGNDARVTVAARSHLTLSNNTDVALAFFGYCPSWQSDTFMGSVSPGSSYFVPIQLASVTHLRLAVQKKSPNKSLEDGSNQTHDYFLSDRLMILPSAFTSDRILRTSILCEQTYHFILFLKCTEGVCDIRVEPIVTVINLLPCQLQCQVGVGRRKVIQMEELVVGTGKNAKCVSVDCLLQPHISVRLPGYRWSSWKRIVNSEANAQTWRPTDDEEVALFEAFKDDVEHAKEFKTIIHLDHKCIGSEPLNIVMSVSMGHSPVIRMYAQYWILDKTGLGLQFVDSFSDILGSKPETATLRKSYSDLKGANEHSLATDLQRQGCEWTLGMNGMTLFFSRREKIALAIGVDDDSSPQLHTNWSSLIDISKVVPTKTCVSVDASKSGHKRFELAYNVTLCQSEYSRTRLITFFPRYQVVNLLGGGLFVAQAGALDSSTYIPPQTWVSFHWENSSLAPTIRIASDINQSPDIWSRGCIPLDQAGVTAMRIPSSTNKSHIVVQVEVRLATKKQNSAVVVVIWSSIEQSNPLYLLRNNSTNTVFCSQPLETDDDENSSNFECFSKDGVDDNDMISSRGALRRVARRRFRQQSSTNSAVSVINNMIQCGSACQYSGNSTSWDKEEFVWTLKPGESIGFGFDDPQMQHIVEWTCLKANSLLLHGDDSSVGVIDVDEMGSSSSVVLPDGVQVTCSVIAEESTKLIVFKDATDIADDESELLTLSFSIQCDAIVLSVIDNIRETEKCEPREILALTIEGWFVNLTQTRGGFHELEVRVVVFHVDNYIYNAEHPVLVFTPKADVSEPFLHLSVVRRLQEHESTIHICYAAIRILELDISLDRKTVEAIAVFLHPLRKEEGIEAESWVVTVTSKMTSSYSKPNRRAPREAERMIHSANSGRLYLEQLHLHPLRLTITFTQEWVEETAATEGLMVFSLIRGMASIADATLTFTSFIAGNAFESPQSLAGIISAHYSSQLTNQMLSLLGSLTILKAPIEIVSNIGWGVQRFFYEPIQGLVKGPDEFLLGLESGTHSLARGILTGFVKGAANATDLVTHNLATLTTDEVFQDSRRAHRKLLMSSVSARTVQDSLSLAGSCVSRGFKSGANGIVDQPTLHASRHGAIGLVKGIGIGLVGAILKPTVGVGDAAVVLMNHVSDATSDKEVVMKVNKRYRRALPRIRTASLGSGVRLLPYDEVSAKAQRIVTGGETVDDAYIGHVQIQSHLIIASNQCLWAIDKKSREPWCVSWTEISSFGIDGGDCMKVEVFSSFGSVTYVFEMSSVELADCYALLSIQAEKMGNCLRGTGGLQMQSIGDNSYTNLPGIKCTQSRHVFGSVNRPVKMNSVDLENEIELIQKCYYRVNELRSSMSNYFRRLDQEAWSLVNSWSQVFTGLSSRRCISIGILNGTSETIQIKSARIVEGGSACYTIPSSEFDKRQGTLSAGGAVIFFGWGAAPSLLQPGRALISIETNVFACNLSDRKRHSTTVQALAGYSVGFLEKSYDESGWWAKYWILIRRD